MNKLSTLVRFPKNKKFRVSSKHCDLSDAFDSMTTSLDTTMSSSYCDEK